LEGCGFDGKALRGSQGTQLVGAINAQSGRTLGVERVDDKSNEIPAGRTLRNCCPLCFGVDGRPNADNIVLDPFLQVIDVGKTRDAH
jgi:hypothetical protein